MLALTECQWKDFRVYQGSRPKHAPSCIFGLSRMHRSHIKDERTQPSSPRNAVGSMSDSRSCTSHETSNCTNQLPDGGEGRIRLNPALFLGFYHDCSWLEWVISVLRTRTLPAKPQQLSEEWKATTQATPHSPQFCSSSSVSRSPLDGSQLHWLLLGSWEKYHVSLHQKYIFQKNHQNLPRATLNKMPSIHLKTIQSHWTQCA